MSLGRALTTRLRSRFEDTSAPVPNRAYSTKRPADRPFDRKLISLPVELISCSNNLAYEAPDIGKITANIVPDESSQPTSPVAPSLPTASEAAIISTSPKKQQSHQHMRQAPSQHELQHHQSAGSLQQRQPRPQPSQDNMLSPLSSASSTRSWDDAMASPALTSASSVTSHEDSRECSPATVDPNPMSSFFLDNKEPPSKKSSLRETKLSFGSRQSTATSHTSVSAADDAAEAVPEIPKRSLTHTKQTHQVLARQRSRSRMSAARESADSSASDPRRSTTAADHHDNPFSAELEQVNELVEELSGAAAKAGGAEPRVEIVDDETQYLIDNGFGCFSAADYIAEIQPLFYRAYGQAAQPAAAAWI